MALNAYLETLSLSDGEILKLVLNEEISIALRLNEITEPENNAVEYVDKLIANAPAVEKSLTLYRTYTGMPELRTREAATEKAFLVASDKITDSKKEDVILTIEVPKGTHLLELPGGVYVLGRGLNFKLEPNEDGPVTATIVNSKKETAKSADKESLATGAIELWSCDIHEFFNECHNNSDGKFCGGGGASGGGSKKGNQEVENSAAKRETINNRTANTTNKATLTKAETDLENLRSKLETSHVEAKVRKDKGAVKEIHKELGSINHDLHNTRKKIYSADDLKRVEEADRVHREMVKIVSEVESRNGKYNSKFEEDILKGGSKFWGEELVRAKSEARGGKVIKLDQRVGQSLNQKAGEWPNPAGTVSSKKSPRPIEVIASPGPFRTKEIDGIKVKKGFEITATDGTKLRLYDMGGGGKNRKTGEMLNTMAYMHELYPQKSPKKIVLLSDWQSAAMVGPNNHAFTFPGTDYIFINKNVPNAKISSRWAMPNVKNVPSTHYIITHEFGHQFDDGNKRSSARGMFENKNIKAHLSTYGKSSAEEGYAEAFTEWHTSEGKTKNPAAVAYAKHEKWYGHSFNPAASTAPAINTNGDRIVRTAEGARRYGVPIGSEIPVVQASITISNSEENDINQDSWDPWAIAESFGIITSTDKDEEESFKNFPKNIPVITENWETGKPKILNMPETIATESEKKEAERIAREVWAELGLEWKE